MGTGAGETQICLSCTWRCLGSGERYGRPDQALLLLAGAQVDVLEYYETSVRSASAQFLIPAVLRVRMYVSKREFKAGRLSLSRRNIVLRDRGQCQCVGMPCYLSAALP